MLDNFYSQKDSLNFSSKRLFIFDFDGVLVDSNNIKALAFAEIYRVYGDDIVNMVVEHHTKNGGMKREDKFKYYHEKFLGTKITQKEVIKLSDYFSNLVFNKIISCDDIEGVSQILNYCIQNKIICAIASATPETELKKIVSQRAWSEVFQYIYGSPHSKVKIINKILRKASMSKEEVVFFGDSINDFDAARECMIDFIGINYSPSEMVGFRDLLLHEKIS